jgi:ADP-heptose:LPS heptosyltransferase
MAHSLEIRVPLVDRDLLRRWLRVAVHRFPLDRQRLLEAADPSIAHTVGSRPKSGFSVPVAQWLQKPGKRDSGANRGLRSWAKVVYSRFKDDTSHMRARSCRMTKCDSAMRILIYRFGQLGDTLIALPALKAIRQQFPAAKIVLLTSYSSRHSWVSIQEVLPQGLIDDFITYDISGSLLTTWTSLWLNFRREAFDLLVYLVPRTRSHFAIVRDLCFFRVCGIKHFVGHRGFDALPKRRDGVPLPAVQHEAEHLLGRLQRDGIALDRPVAAGLTLELTEKERIDGLIWLTKNLGLKSGRPVVGFGPGSKWQSKRWPEDRFAKLGRLLVDELNVFPIIFGGAEDKDLAARLLQHWGDGATAAGELTVRQAAAVLKQCDLYVGNDTGTMHLAVAVGTRCVAIFSAQDWPGRWYPYGTEHTVLRTAPSCEGCKLEVCIDRDIACLRAITVEQVFDAVRRALNDLNSSKRE